MKGRWLEDLPNVLWSYKTTPRKATGETPFNLCFGLDAMIPAEIGSKSLCNIAFDENQNDQLMDEHLVLIDELWETTAKRDAHYKRQVVWCYNSKIRPSKIKEGDWVLMKHEVSRFYPNRKLDLIWEGPY